MKKALIILTFLLSVLSMIHAEPEREFRGAWIATVFGIDWPSVQGTSDAVRLKQQRELNQILDNAQKLGLNAVCFQVRSMADAAYESKEGEPFSSFVSGERGLNPGWDPLEYAVRQSHDRGMALYAWINPFRQSKGAFYVTDADKTARQNGQLLTHDQYTAYNPALEEVRHHVADVVYDIITRYRVDGIIFDDYFYPNKIPEDSTTGDYQDWRHQAPWMSFGDFRRSSVHKAVAEVAAVIEETRPDVRFGISPAGVACKVNTSAGVHDVEPCPVKADDWQWKEIYSDPVAWLQQGTIDFISPQIYWTRDHSTAPYEPIARWWARIAADNNRHFYSSHSLSDIKKGRWPSQEELRAQVSINREADKNQAPGSIFYSAKNLKRLPSDLYSGPALLPVVTWRPAHKLPKIENIKLTGRHLTWDAVKPRPASYLLKSSPDEIIKYAVFSDGRLIGVSYKPSFNIPETKEGENYVVKVYDGYGNLGPG